MPFGIYAFVALLSRNRSAAISARERCVCHLIVPHPSKAIVGPTCSIGGLGTVHSLGQRKWEAPMNQNPLRCLGARRRDMDLVREFPCGPAERMSPHQSGRPNLINRSRTQTNRIPKRHKNAGPVQALDPMLGAGQKIPCRRGVHTHKPCP